jgi:hypothetical protein
MQTYLTIVTVANILWLVPLFLFIVVVILAGFWDALRDAWNRRPTWIRQANSYANRVANWSPQLPKK